MMRRSDGGTYRQWSVRELTTIPALLSQAVISWPNKCFLDFGGSKYSFSETDRESNRLANGLLELGVRAGDRVCAMLGNVPEMIFVWFAANKIGAIFVPFNTQYKGEFLRNQIADSGSSVMFVRDVYVDEVLAVASATPELETMICSGSVDRANACVRLLDIKEVRSSDANFSSPAASHEGPSCICYTSGTTGVSKGCVLSHAYMANMGALQAWTVSLRESDVYWTPCPLFHGSGLFTVLAALRIGSTASIAEKFSVSQFWPEIERSGATIVLLLSIMLPLIADAPDDAAAERCHGQIRSLRGAPLNKALENRIRQRFGIRYVACGGYGSTETGMPTVRRIEEAGAPDGASGRRYDDYDVRILDDEGNECGPGVAGNVILRPLKPGRMFQGYWRRPADTLAAVQDLWFHTGDVGMFDREGWFFFLDRREDCLRRGGENISSSEIEAIVQRHGSINQVAAHAVPSEHSEDELKITVVLEPKATISEAELHVWCGGVIPKFAIPRYIEFRDRLPLTPNGKIQKHLLRAEGVTSRTWDSKSLDPQVCRRTDGQRTQTIGS